jgi:hypothetical protein
MQTRVLERTKLRSVDVEQLLPQASLNLRYKGNDNHFALKESQLGDMALDLL